MIFHDPSTLQIWINIFFAVAVVAVTFAAVTVSRSIRDSRPAHTSPVRSAAVSSYAGRRTQPAHSAA